MRRSLTLLTVYFGIQCAHVLAQAPQTKADGQTPEEVRDAWKLIIRQVPPSMMSLKTDLIPSDQYPKIIALAHAWDSMKDLPVSDADAEKYWKSHYPQPLTPERIESAKTALRRQKFVAEHGDAVKRLRKIAAETAYQMLVNNGSIDPASPACLVFVPSPCPSQKIYERTMAFIDASCKVAGEGKFSVVIVRSPYGLVERMNQSSPEEAKRLADRYEKFIQSGTVKIVDSMPSGTSTPWGFFFRSSQFVFEGGVDGWGQNPQPILKEFKP